MCVTVCTDIERGRESKGRDYLPRSSERCIYRLIGRCRDEAVESLLHHIEQPRSRLITGGAQSQFGNHRTGGEAPHIERQSRTRPRYLERRKRLKVAIGPHVYLCRSLREQVYRVSEPLA